MREQETQAGTQRVNPLSRLKSHPLQVLAPPQGSSPLGESLLSLGLTQSAHLQSGWARLRAHCCAFRGPKWVGYLAASHPEPYLLLAQDKDPVRLDGVPGG